MQNTLLNYHRIVSLNDPLYDDWLDLYQMAFPLGEQMRISSINRILRQDPPASDTDILAVLNAESALAGIGWYEVDSEANAALLWYLAVQSTLRSQGVGALIYAEIRQRALRADPSLTALFMEVEDPAEVHTPEERAFAERRIKFYQRQGALLLGGIRYVQSVGWQPPMPMCLMAHPYQDLTPDTAFAIAKKLFGDALIETGPLTLT